MRKWGNEKHQTHAKCHTMDLMFLEMRFLSLCSCIKILRNKNVFFENWFLSTFWQKKCKKAHLNSSQLDEIWHAYASVRPLTTVQISFINSNGNMGKQKKISSKVRNFNFVLSTDIFHVFFKNARRCKDEMVKKILYVLLKHFCGYC